MQSRISAATPKHRDRCVCGGDRRRQLMRAAQDARSAVQLRSRKEVVGTTPRRRHSQSVESRPQRKVSDAHKRLGIVASEAWSLSRARLGMRPAGQREHEKTPRYTDSPAQADRVNYSPRTARAQGAAPARRLGHLQGPTRPCGEAVPFIDFAPGRIRRDHHLGERSERRAPALNARRPGFKSSLRGTCARTRARYSHPPKASSIGHSRSSDGRRSATRARSRPLGNQTAATKQVDQVNEGDVTKPKYKG